MKEGISKHMALLGVELYEISSKFIYTLRNAHPRPETVFECLPEYTINTNNEANNRPIPARYFHQFVGMGEDEDNKYLYFNLNTLDRLLAEEISQAGIDDLFENIDFKKILSNFKPQSEEDITSFSFPWCYYLVVEITYTTSYDHFGGGYECDMGIDIIGYLDNNMNLKYFEQQ